MYKQDLAINNLQYAIKPNQTLVDGFVSVTIIK